MELPQTHGKYLHERVFVEGNQREGEDENEINVRVPFAEVSLHVCEYFDALVDHINQGEDDEKHPGYLGNHCPLPVRSVISFESFVGQPQVRTWMKLAGDVTGKIPPDVNDFVVGFGST